MMKNESAIATAGNEIVSNPVINIIFNLSDLLMIPIAPVIHPDSAIKGNSMVEGMVKPITAGRISAEQHSIGFISSLFENTQRSIGIKCSTPATISTISFEYHASHDHIIRSVESMLAVMARYLFLDGASRSLNCGSFFLAFVNNDLSISNLLPKGRSRNKDPDHIKCTNVLWKFAENTKTYLKHKKSGAL